MGNRKKKERPILSKEEKDAKKAIKKKKHQERTTRKRERRESNRRKREEGEGDEEEALARSTPSKKMKKTNPNESPTSKKRKAEKKREKKLKKLLKLRKPLILTRKEKRMLKKLKIANIIAWWDYENLSYPTVGAFEMIKNKLRREGYTGKLELHVIVGYKGDPEPIQDESFTMHYGDLKPRPKVGSKDDQKADNHMRTLIKDVLKDKKRALQNTLLITNDNGFSEEIDSLREAGHTVLLATTQESFIITSRAHETWSWKHDFVQVHP